LAFDTTIPFGLTARQQVAWLLHGGGGERMREVFADFNILPFTGGGTGAQMGGWFRKPLGSVADLGGLRMRIPAMGGEVMSRLGVSVQVLSGADVFPALERGTIDAVEWVGPHDDEKLGFHTVAKNYYYPGWWEPGATVTFMVNRTAWDKLPSDYQQAFATASAEASQNMLATYDIKNPAALERLLTQGVQLQRFPDDILEAGRKAATGRLEELAAGNAQFRKIYDEWKQFRETSYRWFAVAEESFTRFAFPPVR
jgi:TRAP-type mannitol/chloroaromatic compound transport system substrate-binding protein